jgi:hypothetical protein
MPNFPLTFPYAGRTFGVVADAAPEHVGGDSDQGSASSQAVVFVRVVGTRGLHEVGPVMRDETDAQLAARVCRWYDEVYGGGVDVAARGTTSL